MTSASAHQSNSYVKLLLLGDAKSGKTGSLASLVAAGYKLRILDLDNLPHFFIQQLRSMCPDKLDNVEICPLRDKYKPTANGMVVDGKPKAWIDSIKMLNEWKYTDKHGTEIDLGRPSDWGPDCILVIDSLSRWSDACYNAWLSLTPTGKSGQDGRAVYGNSQKDIEKQLATLTSDTFETNVIVICHGTMIERDDGRTKLFPRTLGDKLSPNIPTYFSNYIRYTTSGDKRKIQLVSDNMIDLSTTRPDILKESLSVETGLAELFAALRGAPANVEEQIAPKPKAVTSLKRAI